MKLPDQIASAYTVSVNSSADTADCYHFIYKPRATPQGHADGLFHAAGNGGTGSQDPLVLEAFAQVNGEEVAVRWASVQGPPEVLRAQFEQDVQSRVRVLHVWLSKLSALINDVETWGKAIDWSTRRIEKRMEDSQIGRYKAPSLLLQEGPDRVLLEPIARSAPGAEGVVDLYLMPAYDDIASLFFENGIWRLHYRFSGTDAAREASAKPLSKETLQEVLAELKEHAA